MCLTVWFDLIDTWNIYSLEKPVLSTNWFDSITWKAFFFPLGEDFCQNWLSAIASFWNLKIPYPLLRGLRLCLSTLVSFKLYFHSMHYFFSYKGLFISFSKCCIYFSIKTNYTIKHWFNSGILNPHLFCLISVIWLTWINLSFKQPRSRLLFD